MEKVSPGRWKLEAVIPPDRSLHTYKYQIKPINMGILKRFKTGSDNKYIWVPDPLNPLKINDNYGSVNSGIKIRSVRGLREVLLLILIFLTVLAIAMPLFRYLLSFLTKLPFGFLWKFIMISIIIGLFISLTLIIMSGRAIYGIEKQRDYELAEFITGACRDDIIIALNSAELPSDFSDMLNAPDTFSRVARNSSFLDIGFTAVILYNSKGELLRNGDHLHSYHWWETHMDEAEEYFLI